MGRLKHICTLLALALVCGSASAVTQADLDVQTLGNFSKLAKLSSHGSLAAGAYMQRVSKAYIAAGYYHLGPELHRSRVLIMILSKTGDTKSTPAFKLAQTSLLKLSQALAKDSFVKIPKATGQPIPDYYHLAALFIRNTRNALKNVRDGANPAANWGKQGNLWVTTNSNGFVTITGGLGNFSSGTISGGPLLLNPANQSSGKISIENVGDTATFGDVSGSGSFSSIIEAWGGTLTLSAANTFSGSTFINAGTLRIASPPTFGSGRMMLNGGTLIISESGIWAIFPPDVEIPADFATRSSFFEFNVPYEIEGTEYPVGTQIVNVPDGSAIPDGAIELDTPATLTPVATPTPTPTPPE